MINKIFRAMRARNRTELLQCQPLSFGYRVPLPLVSNQSTDIGGVYLQSGGHILFDVARSCQSAACEIIRKTSDTEIMRLIDQGKVERWQATIKYGS